MPIRERRGRPSFDVSKENQGFVAVRVAAGWSQERIAAEMGIDAKTLRKHFSPELVDGYTFIEGMLLDVLMQLAREGHVPSVRQLQSRIERAQLRVAQQMDGPANAGGYLGKKEQQKAAAITGHRPRVSLAGLPANL